MPVISRMRLPVKKLSLRKWLQILGIWTLASLSFATQLYLNQPGEEKTSWFLHFIKQLPAWYLCSLLTPVVVYFYEKHPLDNPAWKKNLLFQVMAAFIILLFFSHFRVAAIAFMMDKSVRNFTPFQYLNAFISQIAWDFTIYAFIVIAVFADKTNTKSRQKELYATKMELRNKHLENELSIAQLEALKLQLSPHFLFNTLNAVSSLIRTEDFAAAIEVNAKLSDFLRTTLYQENNQLVPLRKELELTDLYLDIESIRFKNRLNVIREISTECLSMEVPYLILQPIVENAVKHGIARQSIAKIIAIKIYSEMHNLVISIYNDGKLMTDNWVLKENSGIGLTNVCSRLEKLYGGKASFYMSNHKEAKGVEVILKIPINVL